MAESFENLDNILCDWAGTKTYCRDIEEVRKTGRGKIKPFLLKINLEKVLEQSQTAVERD